MAEHIPGLKMIHVSHHVTSHVRQKKCQRCQNSPEHFPACMIDDVSEHKPDLMPEQASEHRVNPNKSPRSRVIFLWLDPSAVAQFCQID